MDKIERMVIYHAECDDGTTAAAIADMSISEPVGFHPAHYGTEPPDVKDKIVYILDFCYPPDVTLKIAEQAAATLVLDHHKTAMLAFNEALPMVKGITIDGETTRNERTSFLVDQEKKLFVLFDMDRSGASMAWDHFMKTPRPPFVQYVEANDLWRHDTMHKTKEFVRWMRSYPHSIETFKKFILETHGNALAVAYAEGDAIERYFQASVKNHINWSDVRIIKLKDVQGLCVNGPRHMISEIGHELAESCNSFGCVWYPREGRAYVSLRSTVGGPDVGMIAKHYGGGGHANAAGFEMDLFGFVMGVYTGEKV